MLGIVLVRSIVSITGFRGIRELRFVTEPLLGKVTAIVGRNNAGKMVAEPLQQSLHVIEQDH